ncbi:predicted protein [Naegleria gruberi]|uniref:Predicted protein n=1 Tax=Naegleria gruberi TaxID=5762 RepID=D2VQK1_NAEGR|nr:uncharacterized protein NAEGRDRAFT_71254 [Naegleria gruberi]EFC40963.1 predicted protein [Naegleria gruberi]|eukprot:XP_002673707.1 predicted protein [Naegleria gruberi strain NEG-M]
MTTPGFEDSKILHCVIAKGNQILSEATYSSNKLGKDLRFVIESMINRIPPLDTFNISMFESLLIPFLVKDEITILLLCDINFSKYCSKKCCERIRDRWFTCYKSKESYSIPHKEFKNSIKEVLNYYNNNPQSDQIKKCKKRIEAIQNVMISNIDKCIVRADELDLLVDKTETLSNESIDFKNKTRKLDNATTWGFFAPVVDFFYETFYTDEK